MNPLEKMRKRLQELRAQSAALLAERGAILDAATTEERGMTDAEKAKHGDLSSQRSAVEAQIPSVVERVAELEEEATRAAAAAESRVETGQTGEQRSGPRGGAEVTEPAVYREDNTMERSYFMDLFRAQHKQDRQAEDRLRRSDAQLKEVRALGNTSAVGGSGGEFAPPLWLVDQYVKLARPGRIGVDLFNKDTLPAGMSSVNIPRIATGTTVAIQTTQNTALTQTDLTTNSLSSGVVTIGGKQLVALQLLEQSGIPFDKVILEDLALAYAGQIDVQGLAGLGTSGTLRGLGSAVGLTVQAYTQATPAVAGAGGLYAQIQKAIATVYSTRFLAPDTILMHPRRWSFIAASFDAQNRPLVVPVGNAYNPVGTQDDEVAQGKVGNIAGLDVYVDPNIPINLGGAAPANVQDPIYVFKRGDIKLWETSPRMETFTETYADSAGVLFRLYAYSAMVPDRYGSSIVQIVGSGTAPPVY